MTAEIRWHHTNEIKRVHLHADETLMEIRWHLLWLTGAPMKFLALSVCWGVAPHWITWCKTRDWITSVFRQGLKYQCGDWTVRKTPECPKVLFSAPTVMTKSLQIHLDLQVGVWKILSVFCNNFEELTDWSTRAVWKEGNFLGTSRRDLLWNVSSRPSLTTTESPEGGTVRQTSAGDGVRRYKRKITVTRTQKF